MFKFIILICLIATSLGNPYHRRVRQTDHNNQGNVQPIGSTNGPSNQNLSGPPPTNQQGVNSQDGSNPQAYNPQQGPPDQRFTGQPYGNPYGGFAQPGFGGFPFPQGIVNPAQFYPQGFFQPGFFPNQGYPGQFYPNQQPILPNQGGFIG